MPESCVIFIFIFNISERTCAYAGESTHGDAILTFCEAILATFRVIVDNSITQIKKSLKSTARGLKTHGTFEVAKEAA